MIQFASFTKVHITII